MFFCPLPLVSLFPNSLRILDECISGNEGKPCKRLRERKLFTQPASFASFWAAALRLSNEGKKPSGGRETGTTPWDSRGGGRSGRCNTRRAYCSYLRLIFSYWSFFGGKKEHIDSEVEDYIKRRCYVSRAHRVHIEPSDDDGPGKWGPRANH
jgi:hypothetical protein